MEALLQPAPMPELVTVPAGPFTMGSNDGEQDERPPHLVDLAAFGIGVQPVTNGEYARFVQDTGHREPGIHELPLVVSAWLSSMSGRAFRLPTEAEWEKACRGGLRGERYPWGERFDQARVNFLDEPAHRDRRGTKPCRVYPPNGYGIFDIAGNVWEWVQDWYGADAYTVEKRTNPAGPGEGRLRLVRGGSWLSADVRMLRCSHRHKVPPDTYSYAIGFRVASSV